MALCKENLVTKVIEKKERSSDTGPISQRLLEELVKKPVMVFERDNQNTLFVVTHGRTVYLVVENYFPQNDNSFSYFRIYNI